MSSMMNNDKLDEFMSSCLDTVLKRHRRDNRDRGITNKGFKTKVTPEDEEFVKAEYRKGLSISDVAMKVKFSKSKVGVIVKGMVKEIKANKGRN